jgi:hypothetical protein
MKVGGRVGRGFGFGRVNPVIWAAWFGFGRVNPMFRAAWFGFAVVNPVIWAARFGFGRVNLLAELRSFQVRRRAASVLARLAASFAGLRPILFLVFDSIVNSLPLALGYLVWSVGDGSWGCMFMK